MKAEGWSITIDPIWYVTGALFALLTTALPGALGQHWLLPLLQTVTLWLLLLPALRRAALRPALRMLAIWASVQVMTFFALTVLAPARAESAVGGGFAYGGALLAWLYTQAPLPASWATQPLLRVVELLGVTVGSVFTGGLVGIWFLLRSLNLWVFGLAMALNAGAGGAGLLGVLEPWWLLRLIAYALLIAVLASPGFTGDYNPGAWPPGNRRALRWGGALLLAGLLLELLAGPWARLFAALAT